MVNDKVYNGTISFIARDNDSIIQAALVKFTPKGYPHLRAEAFPNETMRTFDVRPIDDVFDEATEEFQLAS